MFCVSCCQAPWRALGMTVWTWGVVLSGHGPSAAAPPLLQVPLPPGISSQCPPCSWRTHYFASTPLEGPEWIPTKDLLEQSRPGQLSWPFSCTVAQRARLFSQDPTWSRQRVRRFGSWFQTSDIWSCSLFISLHVFIDTLSFWWLSS